MVFKFFNSKEINVKLIAVAFSALLLAACGGGGGSDSDTGVTPPPVTVVSIYDSFGRLVFSPDNGGDSGGFGSGDAGADGTAGDGAPIVGGTVVVTDAAGHSVTAVTDSDGYYRVEVTSFTPPFVAKVTKTNGQVRYSLNVNPIKVNGFVTLNISGLTDKIASDVAIAGGKSGAAQLTPQIVSANLAAVTKAKSDLATQFASVITKAGLTPASFDPLSVPFVANNTGYDNVLENSVVTVDSSGATQVAVAATYVPPASVVPISKPSTLVPLPGTWLQTETSADAGSTPYTETVTGAEVPPSSAALTDFYWVSEYLNGFAAKMTASTSDFTYSFSNINTSSSGFSFVLNVVGTGPYVGYNYTMNATINISNYVGCGSCGVGSTVSFSYVSVVTSGGSTENDSGSVRYTRQL
jgi:hypothetical protein